MESHCGVELHIGKPTVKSIANHLDEYYIVNVSRNVIRNSGRYGYIYIVCVSPHIISHCGRTPPNHRSKYLGRVDIEPRGTTSCGVQLINQSLAFREHTRHQFAQFLTTALTARCKMSSTMRAIGTLPLSFVALPNG